MSITKRPFGVAPSGETVTEYTLQNASGASVSILDFGGAITKIVVPDRDGRLSDVILGFDTVAEYAASGAMSVLIGRVGNRIKDASFSLEGKTYTLPKNNNGNCLHGGTEGFGVRMWAAQAVEVEDTPALVLTLVSEDGDQGFPGRLEVTVTYTFSPDNELGIHYQARTDRPTLVNLTNHAYFNLEGHTHTILDHQLQIDAPLYTEVGEGLIPTGRLLPVSQTPFDFTSMTRIGDVLAKIPDDPVLTLGGGVDFNYCAGRDRETKRIATLYAPKTGRVMDVITDQPGVQCYTANFLDADGKGHTHYGRFSGICLETQHYPDAIHQPQFPTIVLRPEDTYDTLTVYRFGVREA